MSAHRQPHHRFSEAEYFHFEKDSPTRHEFFRGEIFAMAGTSFAHVRIVTNILVFLGRKLRGSRCSAFEGNLRIRTGDDGLITYPDVSVFCQPVQLVQYDHAGDAATNPTGLIEVLSKSTEDYDRGAKFELYREMASLRFYLLAAQTEPLVELFEWEQGGEPLRQEARGLEGRVRLATLGLDLPLAEVYRDVDFSAPPPLRVIEEEARYETVAG
ncbi:MAG: Uma2 family endonuclease [Verrucomicrobia bacterium]|nr:Uma2 family endonuclease [Verrucomicrobiota bacterium]